MHPFSLSTIDRLSTFYFNANHYPVRRDTHIIHKNVCSNPHTKQQVPNTKSAHSTKTQSVRRDTKLLPPLLQTTRTYESNHIQPLSSRYRPPTQVVVAQATLIDCPCTHDCTPHNPVVPVQAQVLYSATVPDSVKDHDYSVVEVVHTALHNPLPTPNS